VTAVLLSLPQACTLLLMFIFGFMSSFDCDKLPIFVYICNKLQREFVDAIFVLLMWTTLVNNRRRLCGNILGHF